MLQFNEFCEVIKNRVHDFVLEENNTLQIQLHVAQKLNGTQKTGVTFRADDSNLDTVIYLEEFYEHYQDGTSVERICQTLSDIYEQSKERSSKIPVKDIMNFEHVKDQITMKLINYKDNRRLLMDVPHKKVDDLAVIYKIDVPLQDERMGNASLTLRNEHLEMYGITEKELHSIAYENTKKMHPPLLINLNGSIVSFEEPVNLLEKDVSERMNSMYILTNSEKIFGATMILYPEVMEQTKQVIGEDFYILPSSLHEVILIQKEGYDPRFLGEMVREVNAQEVERDEILSDHVYEYNFKEKEIQTVKESMLKHKEMER